MTKKTPAKAVPSREGKPKASTGRKTKLTPAVHDEIIKNLNAGAYKNHAAEAAGVSVVSLDTWIERGEEVNEEPYTRFAAAVRQAQAADAVRDIEVITKAAEANNWKAAAWKLERKYPKEFGQRHHIEQSIALDNEFADWTDEELKNFAATGKRPKR